MQQSSPWTHVSIFLAGIVLSGAIAWTTQPRNIVSRDDIARDMPMLISQYSPYTKDAQDLHTQLENLARQNGQLQAQVEQLQIDVARISERLGVAAHPGRTR